MAFNSGFTSKEAPVLTAEEEIDRLEAAYTEDLDAEFVALTGGLVVAEAAVLDDELVAA